jgi:molecular chaperone HscA
MAAGAARIRITYQVDADGLLSVSARELRSNVEASITVKPSYGLNDDDITRILKEAGSTAESDMQLRALKEQQVEAQRLILATKSALDSDLNSSDLNSSDAHLLSEAEHATILELLNVVENTVSSEDRAAIESAIKALSEGTEEFAARRMDQSVRTALTGKKLDQI